MRGGVLPAVVIAAAVVAFVSYVSFQGSAHAVDFAVTGSDATVVRAEHPSVPQPWQRRAGSGRLLVVEVSWRAEEPIGPGVYALLVTTPAGWRHVGCRPECTWSADEELRDYARGLPRTPYRLAATFEAAESGDVRVGFGAPRGWDGQLRDLAPSAWLVQTNGDDVLGSEPVPLR